MLGRTIRTCFLTFVVIAVALSARSASADIDSASSTNVQEGDNSSSHSQDGEAQSGDAVAGQVVGVVSAGDTSIDATNSSVGSSASSGSASGANSASSFTGLTVGSETAVLSDIISGATANLQEGDNATEITQAASALGGDGVAGQVIGAVTSSGGSADIVAANTTEDSGADGGSADAYNDAAGFVGLNASGTAVTSAADIVSGAATNLQEGDNSFAGDQSATSAGGDGVAGQVLGVVSAGDTTVDATNLTTGSYAAGGAAETYNFGAVFVGLTAGTSTAVDAADVLSGAAANLQEGDNSDELIQAAASTGGDAVGGQVAGVVTSAGGSADLVLANTSDGVSAEVGDAYFENSSAAFTGLNASGVITVF